MTARTLPADAAPPAAGDRAAAWPLRQVYRDHAEFVWRALRALGVREADADDQTHEVFLVVHRKLAGFEGRSTITTWLFGIAERVASDYRRSARVRREVVTDDVPESPERASAAPDAGVERRQRRAMLETILDSMPHDQRVVFALFELDGLPADQIATLVGCPANTVYSRLRLARAHFERAVARLRATGGAR